MSKRVAVVGGGVIGTAVTLAAVDRGHEVLQFERDEEPRGASVRNFGLVWVCAVPAAASSRWPFAADSGGSS